MKPRILFLDDNADLRIVMKELFKTKLGEDCLCFSSLAELKDNSADVLNTKISIIDVNLGNLNESGLEAYRWFQNNQYKGRIIFLTGHARSHPLVVEAKSYGTLVWEKPIDADQICHVISSELNGTGIEL